MAPERHQAERLATDDRRSRTSLCLENGRRTPPGYNLPRTQRAPTYDPSSAPLQARLALRPTRSTYAAAPLRQSTRPRRVRQARQERGHYCRVGPRMVEVSTFVLSDRPRIRLDADPPALTWTWVALRDGSYIRYTPSSPCSDQAHSD